MLDGLIGLGAMFDWITPLWTFIQDFWNRPSVGYNIPVDGGWSAYAVRDLLKGAGVKTWGLTIFGNTITFRARKAQAEYAQYLMGREAIPYQGGVRTVAQGGYQRAHRRYSPPSRSPRTDPIDQIVRLLDKL